MSAALQTTVASSSLTVAGTGFGSGTAFTLHVALPNNVTVIKRQITSETDGTFDFGESVEIETPGVLNIKAIKDDDGSLLASDKKQIFTTT